MLGSFEIADIRQKTRIGRTASDLIFAGLCQAELAVDSQAHILRVFVFPAVFLPPTTGT
jgi:hypothetical protein